MLVTAVMFAAMAGCSQGEPAPQGDVQSGTAPETENVGAVEDSAGDGTVEASAEVLEALGMSAEEFAAMDPEKQKAIMDEMGAVLENQQQQTQQQEQAKSYTPDDVMAGGRYKVVMGDYMNSITLYYEDGKLVKLESSFQKSSEEEEEVYVAEGDALKEYNFNFIDWANAPLQEILDGMKDYGAFGEYRIYAE